MEQVNVQLIVGSFEHEDDARAALDKMKELENFTTLRFLDAAVIERADNEKLHIHETADPGGGKGAAAGGTIGALIGVIAGPPGIVIGGAVGALVGGVTAKEIDSGIPDDRLKELAEHVSPGTSALAIMTEVPFAHDWQREMEKLGGKVVATHIRPDIPDQLASEDEADEAPAEGEEED